MLGAVLGWVVLVSLVAPRNPWFEWPMTLVRVAAAVLLVAALVLARRSGRVARLVAAHPRRAVLGGTAVAAVLIGLHLPLALIDVGWDAGNVLLAASRVAEGMPQGPGMVDYFAKFPNNIPVTALFAGAIAAGSPLGLPPLACVLVLQGVGATLVVWSLGSALVHLDRPGAVWPVQAVAVVLLGLSPHAATPYADVPAATCVALALWAGSRAWAGRGRAWWLVALGLAVLAVALKPYAVALVLGGLTLLLPLARRGGWSRVAVVALVVLGTLGAGVAAVHAVAGRASGLAEQVRAHPQEQHPFPPLHYLTMGTYDSRDPSPTRTYGGWEGPYSRQTGEVTDPQEREVMLRERLARQLQDQGAEGTARFLALKLAWFWGDGTFYAHGEAADRDDPGLLGPGWAGAQSWFIGSGEPYRGITAPLVQALWLVVLACSALGAWRLRAHPVVMACATTLVVLTGYLALFEARARYLVALVPVLLLLLGLVGLPGGRSGDRSGATAGAARRSAPDRLA